MTESNAGAGQPKVASRLEDLKWFESVLTMAQDDLARTPEEYKPAWYRELPEKGAGATRR